MPARVAYVNIQAAAAGVDHGNAHPLHDPQMTDVDVPRITRRLKRLLAHLKVSDADFAAATGLKPSYVSRLVNGQRGASGDAPKLFLKTAEVYGVGGRYWSARDDVDPAECIRSAEEDTRTMGKPDSVKARLVDLSAERDDPPEVVKELARTSAPPGADALWWFKRYLELLDAHR